MTSPSDYWWVTVQQHMWRPQQQKHNVNYILHPFLLPHPPTTHHHFLSLSSFLFSLLFFSFPSAPNPFIPTHTPPTPNRHQKVYCNIIIMYCWSRWLSKHINEWMNVILNLDGVLALAITTKDSHKLSFISHVFLCSFIKIKKLDRHLIKLCQLKWSLNSMFNEKWGNHFISGTHLKIMPDLNINTRINAN